LELLAAGLAGSVEDRGSLVTALRRVGASCSGCHEDYRLNRN
jgi:cytochrome c556